MSEAMRSCLQKTPDTWCGVKQEETPERLKRPLRILALVPPDETAVAASKYSFLHEELVEMASAGAEIHAVSHHIRDSSWRDGVLIHSVPRLRDLVHSAKSLYDFLPSTRFYSSRLSVCRLISTIQSVLVNERIDVVYSPFLWPLNTAGLPAAERQNVPVVVSLRGADVLTEAKIGYGRTLDAFQRRAISDTLYRADKVIGVSSAMVKRALELGARPGTTEVVLKGVCTERFKPGSTAESRQKLGLPSKPTVLFVGNLIKRKGVDLLLHACAQVARTLDVHLAICGDGPEREPLADLAGKLGIASRVTFAGRVSRDEIPDYFRACDVHVLPSLVEGSGNVLLEAYACRKPVIGTRASGILDYVDDGVTGLLFEKESVMDLADKIRTILSDDLLAARLAANGLERVRTRHAHGDVIERIFDIFLAALQSRR